METTNKHYIHSLWVNNTENKIDIYIDIFRKKLIFHGKSKKKINKTTTWNVFSKKEYDIGDEKNNFEKACKEVYAEMQENLQLLEGVQNFLAETTQIEIRD